MNQALPKYCLNEDITGKIESGVSQEHSCDNIN